MDKSSENNRFVLHHDDRRLRAFRGRIIQKLGNLNAETAGNTTDHADIRLAYPGFPVAYGFSGHKDFVGKLLLRKILSDTQFTNTFSEMLWFFHAGGSSGFI